MDLPEIYRTTLIMHDIEGYTHTEIAEVLGVAEGTCKSRLSQARAQLRAALADLAPEFGIMTDERFDELMRDAEKTYPHVRRTADFDAMWAEIEAARFRQRTRTSDRADTPNDRGTRGCCVRAGSASPPRWSSASGSDAVACCSAVTPRRRSRLTVAVAERSRRSRADDPALARPYEVETSQYLGQTAALLVVAAVGSKAGRADQQFADARRRSADANAAADGFAGGQRSGDAQPARGSRAGARCRSSACRTNGKPHRSGSHQPRAGTARRHSAAAHGGRRHFCELRRAAMKRITLGIMMLVAAAGDGASAGAAHAACAPGAAG